MELLCIGDIVGQAQGNGEEQRTEKHCQQVREALEANQEGISKRQIRKIAGLNSVNVQKAIDALLSQEAIEEIEMTHPRNHKPYTRYLLVDKKSKQESTLNRGTEDVVGGGV